MPWREVRVCCAHAACPLAFTLRRSLSPHTNSPPLRHTPTRALSASTKSLTQCGECASPPPLCPRRVWCVRGVGCVCVLGARGAARMPGACAPPPTHPAPAPSRSHAHTLISTHPPPPPPHTHTHRYMSGSLFSKYPFDVPSEQFSPELFRQAFAAVQSCVVHLQARREWGGGGRGGGRAAGRADTHTHAPCAQGVPLSKRFALVPLGPPLLTYSSTCRALLRFDAESRQARGRVGGCLRACVLRLLPPFASSSACTGVCMHSHARTHARTRTYATNAPLLLRCGWRWTAHTPPASLWWRGAAPSPTRAC